MRQCNPPELMGSMKMPESLNFCKIPRRVETSFAETCPDDNVAPFQWQIAIYGRLAVQRVTNFPCILRCRAYCGRVTCVGWRLTRLGWDKIGLIAAPVLEPSQELKRVELAEDSTAGSEQRQHRSNPPQVAGAGPACRLWPIGEPVLVIPVRVHSEGKHDASSSCELHRRSSPMVGATYGRRESLRMK